MSSPKPRTPSRYGCGPWPVLVALLGSGIDLVAWIRPSCAEGWRPGFGAHAATQAPGRRTCTIMHMEPALEAGPGDRARCWMCPAFGSLG